MTATSLDSYCNSGDDLRPNMLRATTAPVAAFPSHPVSLMPGQASRATPRPNFHAIGASRRMTIADDIRTAHNIPPPLPPPPSHVPLYPSFTEDEQFTPRPAPPVPSESTPPPPRPPLPPSLTAAAFRVSVQAPPIPPKPFIVPFSSQEDGRPKLSLSTLPRSLMPGGQSTQVMDPVMESAEQQAEENDIAAAMALSASISDEEANQRQMLVLQEAEDLAKALEASMLETGNSGHHVGSVASSSSNDRSTPSTSQSAPSNHEASEDEALALALAISIQTADTGCSTSADLDPGSAPSQSVTSINHELYAATLTPEQEPTTTAPPIQTREPTPPTSPELPAADPSGAVDGVDGSTSTISADNAHIEHGVPLPSPLTPSDLAYLRREECLTPRVEEVSKADDLSIDATITSIPLSDSPELITTTELPTLVTSDSIPGRQESLPNTAIESSPVIPAKFKEAHAGPSRDTSGLPEYSPRVGSYEELPSSFSSKKSTPILKHSEPTFVGESNAISGSSSSPDAVFSEPLPPSYSETPLPATEDSAQQKINHTNDSSVVSLRNANQLSVRPPLPRPPSSISTASTIHHRLSSATSQADIGDKSPVNNLSRNSSATSSVDPDGNSSSSSSSHSTRSRANSTINLNAFVSKELLFGVSIGFMAPKISPQLVPMAEEMPPIISLPYGKARPLHLQGPSWRHLLKLMAGLSGTRVEAALDAIAATKTPPKLRTVIQFIKPHHNSSVWRTIFYFTIDFPPPQPSVRHRSVNDLPYSYSLAGIPTLLRDSADTPHSKTYTVPASDLVPYPTLPITFPSLALYMQAALEESRRYLHDSHSDYRKLARMITTCYPDEDVTPVPPERRGLFSRVMGRSSKPQKRGGNEDTYELVTPFVPDEWG